MVFRPKPRRTPAHIKVKGCGCHSDGLVERCLCFLASPKLAERGGSPAIGKRKIGVRSDHSLDRLECCLVLAAEIMPDRYLQQSQREDRIAGIEPEIALESCESLFRPPRVD